jgi:hypothetical protein
MQHLDDGLLHALVDGEVPSAELGPIQAHLDSCAGCRVRLDEARSMAGESNALIELIEVPAAAPASLGSAAARPRRAAATWLRPLGLAASLALAVGLGYAGGALQREDLAVQESRIDTVFVAQDRAAVAEPNVPAPATVAPAATPEAGSSLQRLSSGTREEQEHADERRRQAAPQPAEADRTEPARLTAQASADSTRQKALSSQFRPDEAVVPPAAARKSEVAGNQARDLKDSAMLKRANNEVKQSLEGAAKSVAAAPPARVEDASLSMRAVPITFYEATTLLGGQLRLIDGMVPARLEQIGTAVRVVYALERGELFLEQRRDSDSLAVTLIAPTLAGDSIAKLRAKIR